MIEKEEQGFLSHKFNDFGSEPIPNGWSGIEKQLAKDRRRLRPVLWFMSGVLLLLLSGLGVWLSKQPSDLKQIARVEKQKSDAKGNSEKNSQGQKVEGTNPSRQATSGTVKDDNAAKSNAESSNVQGDEPATNSSGENQNQQVHKDLPAGSKDNVEGDESSNLGGNQKNDNVKTRKHVVVSVPFVAKEDARTRRNSTISESRESNQEASNNRQNRKAKSGLSSSYVSANQTVGEINSMENSGKMAVEPIDRKTPVLILDELATANPPILVSQPYARLDSPKTRKIAYRPLTIWAGGSIGYAQKTITVNQPEAVNRIDVGNSFHSDATWMAQLEGKMLYQPSKLTWLQLLSGISLGLYQQNTSLQSADKQPTKFSFQMKDSLNYSVDPNWGSWVEMRNQQLYFANFELGFKPLLSKSRQSGPFISALIWTRLSQQNSTSSDHGSVFEAPKSSVALGYKLGYQHLISGNWQVEIFTTALPQNLIATTKGLSIRPQFFGIGINRKVW